MWVHCCILLPAFGRKIQRSFPCLWLHRKCWLNRLICILNATASAVRGDFSITSYQFEWIVQNLEEIGSNGINLLRNMKISSADVEWEVHINAFFWIWGWHFIKNFLLVKGSTDTSKKMLQLLLKSLVLFGFVQLALGVSDACSSTAQNFFLNIWILGDLRRANAQQCYYG